METRRTNDVVCKGRFFGGEIEPGIFHGGEIEPGTFHNHNTENSLADDGNEGRCSKKDNIDSGTEENKESEASPE